MNTECGFGAKGTSWKGRRAAVAVAIAATAIGLGATAGPSSAASTRNPNRITTTTVAPQAPASQDGGSSSRSGRVRVARVGWGS